MNLDLEHPAVTARRAPTVAAVADDDLTARRIDAALDAAGMAVELRSPGIEDVPCGTVDDPDILVVVFGRGVTERDQRMRRLRKAMPEAHLVAIMPEDSRRGVRRALEAGADGVVFDSEIESALSWTIRAVLAGQAVVPAAGRHEMDRPSLSSREKQILSMVVAGMSNKEIAGKLFLAESTIKCHLSSSFTKLGVRSRNEASDLIMSSSAGRELGLLAAPEITGVRS